MINASSLLTSILLRPALALLVVLLLGLAGGAQALSAPAGDEAAMDTAELPAAEEILDRFVQVTGGRKAHEKIRNRVTHGTFELVGQGIQGETTIYAARPNLLYAHIQIDALGTIERGVDGKTAWEKSAMTGPVIKSGQEKIDMLRDATFDRLLVWRDIFTSAETTGEAEVDGKICHVVQLTPPEGNPQTLYFQNESGLLVRMDTTAETQMGSITVESYIGGYRTVGDLFLAGEVRMMVMGQERRMTTNKVEHNVDLAADRFALPEDVEALAQQQAAGGQ